MHTIEEAEAFIGGHAFLSQLLLSAKQEYTAATGKILENDDGYLPRVKSYLYWFLFDWPIPPQKKINVFQYFLDEQNDLAKKAFASQLQNSRHSLFIFDKHTKAGVRIIDLFTNLKFELADQEAFQGMNHGDWFESRIFEIDGYQIFSDYFLIHPESVLKQVKPLIKHAKTSRAEQTALIFKLQASYVKWKNYKMIDLSSIYNFSI